MVWARKSSAGSPPLVKSGRSNSAILTAAINRSRRPRGRPRSWSCAYTALLLALVAFVVLRFNQVPTSEAVESEAILQPLASGALVADPLGLPQQSPERIPSPVDEQPNNIRSSVELLEISDQKTSAHELSVIEEPASRAKSQVSLPAKPIHKNVTIAASADIKVAYVISITGCPTDPVKPPTATVDGPAVLAHSIRRLPTKYPTDLIAFVHPNATNCTGHLPRLGYQVMERGLGFMLKEIKNRNAYRKYIKYHGCCEELEFLKLEAYSLVQYSIVMHLDTDILILQPMDAIVDAMMGIDTSGIQVLHKDRPLPPRIDFVYTRDYVQMSKMTNDTSKFAVQGGFFAVRPNARTYRRLINTVKSGSFDMMSGWARKSYGGYYGAPQIQGMLSFFYGEHDNTHSSVELDPCVYNSMVSFPPIASDGFCRYHDKLESNKQKECRDCADLSLSQLHSTHYTVCYKPWVCPKHKRFGQLCKDTHRAWFNLRRELEVSWGYEVPTDGWNYNITGGYCTTPKWQGYIPLKLPTEPP